MFLEEIGSIYYSNKSYNMVMMMCFCIIEMFIMDCELNKYKIKFRFDIRVLSLVICC